MPLAGDEHDIARIGLGERCLDRLGTVGDHADIGCVGCAPRDVGENGLRILVARIVAGQDHDVGQACRNFAHQRALARIAVAAAAEDADQAPAAHHGRLAQGHERLLQRIRRVRVVNHYQRLPLPAESLHASGRESQPLQHGGCLVERHIRGQQCAEHGKEIGDVETAHHRRRDIAASLPRHGREAQAARRRSDILGSQQFFRCGVQRAAAAMGCHCIADHADAAAGKLARDLAPERIVEVEHGRLEPGCGEQQLLRRAVGLHAAVVLEVVARQIGEHRHAETHAVRAALMQADRGDLHRRCLRTQLAVFGQQTLQRDRIRRGVEALFQLARDLARATEFEKAAAERADHRAGLAQQRERLGDPLAHRGLAVGAGHANRPKLLRGAPIHQVGNPSRQRLQAVHRHVRHGECAGIGIIAAFPQNACGAARHGIVDVAATVGALARIGDEHVPGRHRAGVRAQAGCHHTLPLQFVKHALRFLQFTLHSFSGTSGAGSRATWTGLSGASGGTPSVRRLPAITCANTGAATSPP